MARRFMLADLSPDARAEAERQLAGDGPIFSAEGRRPAAASAYTGGGGGAKAGKSRNEQRFSDWLEGQAAAGLLSGWLYEPLRVRLAARQAYYTADFYLWTTPAWRPWEPGPSSERPAAAPPLVAVELKPRTKAGRPYLREASWLRARLAADRLAAIGVHLFLVWPAGRGPDAGWCWELVKPSGREA